jgi:hypothetical protein
MRLDELFSRALREQRSADPNDEDSEDLSYLVELHNRTTRETYDRAVVMVGSAAADERVLGLRVLRELGPWGHRTFRADAVPLLRGVIAGHRDEPGTLYSALYALAWQGDESVLPDILRFTDADDTSVRSAAIHNLTNFIDRHEPDDNVLAALLAATRDQEPGNRYSAVYDLVHWVDCTRDDVRSALAARLDDDDEIVREHAIAGLATYPSRSSSGETTPRGPAWRTWRRRSGHVGVAPLEGTRTSTRPSP